MAITLITPHQRPNSGGVDAIQQFARHASPLTEVHVVVAKGDPVAIDGVHVHGPDTLTRLDLPNADALLIPADMRNADRLFGLAPGHGVPMLFFQGYGTPGDPVVHANLVLAAHVICTASWLVDEAVRAGCTATLVRYGLDRQIFSPGPSTEARGPCVAMMTHPRDWKGTADGLEALTLARREQPEIEVLLFGKVDTGFEGARFLASPNEPPEVAALLHESSVFVCPSWEEGFGLPGLEAIASGAALATTDTKGSRDYAFHARTALVSAPHDPPALAQHIVDLIRDAGLRKRLLDAGQEHVDAIYPDWERAAEAFVSAVDDGARTVTTARRAQGTPGPGGEDDHDSDLISAQSFRRQARRAKLMLREAESERNEIEAELGRRLKESADSRRRLRELQVEVEQQRDAHERSEIARSALDGRATQLAKRLAEAEERISELESAARTSARELGRGADELAAAQQSIEGLRRQLEAAVAARQQLDTDLKEVRRALEGELDDTREAARAELAQAREALEAALREAQREAELAVQRESALRQELRQATAELELTTTQRARLQAALGRARADAQVAEAERSAFERRLEERSEHRGNGDAESRRARRWSGARPVGSPSGSEALSRPPTGSALGAAQGAPTATLAAVHRLPSAARAWAALPASERDGQSTFIAEYRELTARLPPSPDGRDPLALPMASDPRGLLAAADEDQGQGVRSVDVVVCVHNALEDARRCLWSVLHKAGRRFRLIVVDDGSDEATTSYLTALAETLPTMTMIHRPDPPHGYTLAANEGLRASTGDYVVLLNSDTIVSYGWMERIVDYGERHDRVGILGPLSNAASHQSVPERRTAGEWATNPLPGWVTEDGLALILTQAAPRTNTRLPFINGFCYVIRRAVIEAIGYFDEELFAPGYAEENDYSQRARTAGFELAVVDDAYVYHAKSRSYGTVEGKQVARRAYQVFREKHGPEEIDRLVKEMEADTTLNPVRAAVGDALSNESASAAAVAQTEAPLLSVAFVLPGLGDGGSGGSHSIYQEVHGLRRLGVPARIALQQRAWDRACRAYDDAAEIFEPYEDADELAQRTADANVIVATHFKSVATVAGVRSQRDDFLAAYYVQDYEPMFKFADPADNAEAAASYTAIPGALLFAKTHWLCNVICRRHGVFVAKVEPSIDATLFKANELPKSRGPVHVAAMLRPRTPRRQPYSTIAVLERLLDEFPRDVNVTTFGCRAEDLSKITKSTAIHASHRGLLKRDQVAELLRNTDVFLDMSTYQAFGRTAVEAMACGATAVIPQLGGVWDFARSDANLLAVDTLDREAAFTAIAGLAEDRERLARLQVGARQTASRYSILRAALSEYVVFRHAYQARQR